MLLISRCVLSNKLAAILTLCVAISFSSNIHADSDHNNDSRFSLKSIKGNYGFLISGQVIDLGNNTIVPGAIVGHFTADGKGKITKAVRTLNTGGDIYQEIFTGTYIVNPDGTGTVTIIVSTLLPDGSSVPAVIETGHFVITQPNNELHILTTSIKGPAGEELGVRLVANGVARKQ